MSFQVMKTKCLLNNMRYTTLFSALVILLISGSRSLMSQTDPYLQGRALYDRGAYQQAAVALEQANELSPGKTEILYHLGIAYLQQNKTTQAREALYSVEKREPGMASLHLARVEARLNHPEQSLKYLRTHLSSRYRVPEKDILLDPDLESLQTLQGWQDLWNEKSWYSQGDRDFQEAMHRWESEDALEAINLLNQLEKTGFKKSKVLTLKADIYRELGNTRAVESSLEDAVKSDIRNLEALEKLAEFQLREGDSEEAELLLDRLIRRDPARFEAYLLRAQARSQNEDLAGALEDVDLYLEYIPAEDEVLYLKGSIQFSHGKYLGAIQSFNSALSLNSGDARYYYSRGLTYAATGTLRYAEKDMSMALDLDPYNGEIWFEKGNLSSRLGKTQEACMCYRKAQQYGIFEAGELINRHCR